MKGPGKEGADRRPRLSVVISVLRSRESGLGTELRRESAGPPTNDEHGVPVDQLPLTVAGHLRRLVTR
jgi:hypothetical protein